MFAGGRLFCCSAKTTKYFCRSFLSEVDTEPLVRAKVNAVGENDGITPPATVLVAAVIHDTDGELVQYCALYGLQCASDVNGDVSHLGKDHRSLLRDLDISGQIGRYIHT